MFHFCIRKSKKEGTLKGSFIENSIQEVDVHQNAIQGETKEEKVDPKNVHVANVPSATEIESVGKQIDVIESKIKSLEVLWHESNKRIAELLEELEKEQKKSRKLKAKIKKTEEQEKKAKDIYEEMYSRLHITIS